MNEHEMLRHGRILLVDDEPEVSRLLGRLLEQAGFQARHILATSDSREALRLHRQHRSDVVVVDLNMPQVDGFQLLQQFREFDPALPVLVLSGSGNRHSRMQALSLGARDFLEKPFDHEAVRRIRNHLESRRVYLELQGHRDRLEELVDLRTRDLVRSRLETAKRLGMAAEYRDDDTGTHILRMSRYCEVLARACEWPESEVELILHASPLHDIGKIAIPDSILLKPGRLTREEFETMKTHTTIGSRMLARAESEVIQLAETIAHCHHEKWDGSGYPRGLAGPEIPVPARLVAVCDVFDALTSERPYKRAWPVEQAVAEIERTGGSHFDPEMVARFLPLVGQFMEIRSHFERAEHVPWGLQPGSEAHQQVV